jgi:hypothetical protein
MAATLRPPDPRAPRGIFIAVALSLAAHALLLAVPMREPRIAETPTMPALRVELVRAEPTAPTLSAMPPEPIPVAREEPTPKRLAKAEPARRAPARREPLPEPVRAEKPPLARPTPRFDMAALIEAHRERRLAMDRALAARSALKLAPPEDTSAASLDRNLRSLTRDEGVGGVFQILSKGTRDAEFAFNGWRSDQPRRWREVIEVEAKPGEDIELAIVRRMIQLIRGHYTGDFQWQSYRLGRVIVLSARPEDNDGLEDFLVREFFGTPTLRAKR